MLDFREKSAESDHATQAQDSRMKQKQGMHVIPVVFHKFTFRYSYIHIRIYTHACIAGTESRGIEVFKTIKAGDNVVVRSESGHPNLPLIRSIYSCML